MIFNPKPGERIRIHYAEKKRQYFLYHGETGTIRIAPTDRRAVRNCLVELDSGRRIVVPAGNLYRVAEAQMQETQAIDKVVTKETTRQCKHFFSEKERLEIAEEFAQADQELQDIERELSNIKEQYKARKGKAESTVSFCASKLRNGYEMRKTECLITLDYDDSRVRITRLDNDEVVEDRAMSEDERQMELFGSGDGNGREEAGYVAFNFYWKREGEADDEAELQQQYELKKGEQIAVNGAPLVFNGDAEAFCKAFVEAWNEQEKVEAQVNAKYKADLRVFVRADLLEEEETPDEDQDAEKAPASGQPCA